MRRFAAILLALAVMLACCGVAFADGDAIVNDFDAAITVMNDGSLEIVETITYTMTDSINGFTRDIDPTIGTGVGSFSAALVQPGGSEKEFTWDTNAEKGDEGVMYYAMTDDGLERYYIFEPCSDGESITMRYYYTLDGVSSRYADVGTINFPVIGDAWQMEIENYTASVSFENSADGEVDVRIPRNSTGLQDYSLTDNVLRFKGTDAGDGTELRVRLIFPQELLSGMAYTKNVEMRDTLLAKEAADMAYAQHTTRLGLILLIAGAALVLLISIAVRVLWDREPAVNIEPYHAGAQLPVDGGVTPAEAALLAGALDSNALAATLLDLVRRGALRMYVENDETFYQATGAKVEMKHFEIMAMNWMLKLGDGDRVSLERIKEAADTQKYSEKFGKWSEDVTKEFDSHNWKRPRPLAQKVTAGVLFALAAVSIAGAFYLFCDELATAESALCLVGDAVMFIAAGLYCAASRQFTVEGRTIERSWKSVKDWMKGSWSAADMPADTKLWEQLMVYSLALGCGEKLGKKLDEMEPGYADAMRQSSDAVLLRMNDRGFDDGFFTYYCVTSSACMRSTYSSSSSGGSAGSGAGGGGGGGTF